MLTMKESYMKQLERDGLLKEAREMKEKYK